MSYLSRSSDHVRQLFSKIAPKYDLVNCLMSGGLHHYWNRKLVQTLEAKPSDRYLDLCAGTGAISKIYLKKIKPASGLVLLDFCPEMLSLAEKTLPSYQKQENKEFTFEFICADACQIPLKDADVDRISMAYGLRNIIYPQKALEECLRVLKPGGRISILELTRPKTSIMKSLHRLWLKYVVARVAAFYSRQGDAYKYLEDSIHHFIEPQTVLDMLKQCGFVNTKHIALSGQIASLFTAEKPSKDFSNVN